MLSTAMNLLWLLITHPDEFSSVVNFKLFHEKKRDLTAQKEHKDSGWDRATMRRCWEFLDSSSRSFAAVIKELDGDLARTVCLFYLVLRGLDTIEDDTTLPDEQKQKLLRNFVNVLDQPGWSYDGIRQEEKDRQVLVEFDAIIAEVQLLEPYYKDVIKNMAERMSIGMADFCHRADTGAGYGVDTLEEYDLYCHYVAGLVGEGLSGLFSASGKEASWVKDELVLSNSMGLLLQKTNVLRDYREDVNNDRLFWPREIWSRYGFKDPREMYEPENEERALWALSEMTLDALRHSVDALDYLTLLKNQSIFNFCAIPATMAIATLDICFMNRDVLHKNVKIRRSKAVQLIMKATNPRDVAHIFVDYARKIHAKVLPSDPNHLPICAMCGQIEQWAERHYPSFVNIERDGDGIKAVYNDTDIRAGIYLNKKKTIRRDDPKIPQKTDLYLLLFVVGGILLVCFVGLAAAWGVAMYFGSNSQ